MNWGKGITLFMVMFMAFIVSMVYYAFTKNADLVQEDYYENEINYDKNKESKSNYDLLEKKVVLSQKEEGVVLEFPDEVVPTNEGKITFYRPDQKKYDREFALKLNDNNQQILTYENFKEGYYDVTVEWSDGTKNYIFEDQINF